MTDNIILAGLMKRAADGDDAAFESLVREFERPVFALAMQSTQNREDAEDITQEVFMKIWRSRGDFRGDCSVATWFFRIARNTINDSLRRRTKHQSISLTDDDSEETDIPTTDDDPAESYERKERIKAVRRAIRELSAEHRELILLRDMNGLSYKEITELTGLDEGTVKSRLFRARNNLREILKKRNFSV